MRKMHRLILSQSNSVNPTKMTSSNLGLALSIISRFKSSWASLTSPYEKHPIMKNITLVGSRVLREKAREVNLNELSSHTVQDTLTKMRDIMIKTDEAVGVSAPQLGVSLRICAVQYKEEWVPEQHTSSRNRLRNLQAYPLTFFINPILKVMDSSQILDVEGCLSIPHYHGWVQRNAVVEVKGWNEFGEELHWKSISGWMARILQHEIDHLDGILFIDRLFNQGLRHNSLHSEPFESRKDDSISTILEERQLVDHMT